MEDAEILEKVKTALGVTGTYQDNLLNEYIYEVKCFLLDAGVDRSILSTAAALGVISRGVADLWNYGNGNTALSEYFYQRAKQLALMEAVENEDV